MENLNELQLTGPAKFCTLRPVIRPEETLGNIARRLSLLLHMPLRDGELFSLPFDYARSNKEANTFFVGWS